ncbi:MAG: hypothetical protein D6812_13815 [Deltaproteobacteria bacterium]|nr:MAG: hypothetical protein D6812_13815 [Deltaproteobacteria bacterium]
MILDRLHYELTNTYIRRESLFVIADESASSSRRRRSRRNRSRFRKKQESEDSQTVFIGRHNGDSQTPLDTLIFTTTANFVFTPDARESDLVEVIYYPVEDRERGEIVLRRREYKMPVGDLDVEREDCTPERHCTDFAVYRGIRGIGFRYYTDDRFGDRFDQDEWDSTSARDEEQYNRVPRAVEITLVLESSAGTDLLFRTIVAVPAGFATGRK